MQFEIENKAKYMKFGCESDAGGGQSGAAQLSGGC